MNNHRLPVLKSIAGLFGSTIASNLHNRTNLSPEARTAMNRTAIKQHRLKPVCMKTP